MFNVFFDRILIYNYFKQFWRAKNDLQIVGFEPLTPEKPQMRHFNMVNCQFSKAGSIWKLALILCLDLFLYFQYVKSFSLLFVAEKSNWHSKFWKDIKKRQKTQKIPQPGFDLGIAARGFTADLGTSKYSRQCHLITLAKVSKFCTSFNGLTLSS